MLVLSFIFFLYPRYSSTDLQQQSPIVENSTPKDTPQKQDSPAPAEYSPSESTWEPVPAGNARKQQQTAISNLLNLPVQKQLEYQFPYDVSSKFPAYIWQTWKYTPANSQFEEKFRVTEASWTEKHPDFVHEVITDQVAAHLIRHLYSPVPDVLEAYISLPLPILKADFFRYLILLARGGVYADIDTVALQPATDWIADNFKLNTVGLVVGIEADPDRPDWAEWYSRRIQFCQWTIQSKSGHPVLREIVANITAETLKRKKEGKLTKNHDNVIEFTGPAVWTDTLFDYFNDADYFDMSSSTGNISWVNFTGMTEPKKVGDVVVLPITSFSPGIGHSGAGDTNDPMAFVKHEFEGSWKPESERIINPGSNNDDEPSS
ncbi:alpha-1,6-mannosyltransferase Och1 [Rhizina undulata]